jgi:crotonobetaine/carnitine-CoA ligase
LSAASSSLELLRAAAAASPDATFLKMQDARFSFGEALELVNRVAGGLRKLGIERGERVGIMSDNRPEAVWAWLAVNAVGAIDVPFNSELRGDLLARQVRDCRPRMVMGAPEYLGLLEDAGHDATEIGVVFGSTEGQPLGAAARHVPFEDLLDSEGHADSAAPSRSDPATVIYTSGTTGPSKGVVIPQRYWPALGEMTRDWVDLRPGETAYCVQPLFHIDARTYVMAALAARATTVIGRRFSVSGFWDDVRHHGADVIACIGTMMWLLHKQPPTPEDQHQPARIAIASSTPPEIHRSFEERFALQILEWYGQTESGCVAYAPRAATRPGSIGVSTPHYEVRILDDGDEEVSQGQVGELCFRPRQSYVMMQGYWNNPDATVAAWRNLWFHTGDHARVGEDDQFEFVGRKKDAIRRRGENVSAWEVEDAVTRHPDVLEAAAIGVPSPLGEEDVAVLVLLRDGAGLDAPTLRAFLAERLPRYAVPRYVELVDGFPKTATERIEKAKVRERGISPAAWDAERS